MSQTRRTDVAIIGAGTAGMAAYRAVKSAGLGALLIEGGPYGTTCARVGCMPSKLLIAAAEAAHHARHTAPFGVHVDGPIRIDGHQVMQRVKSERDRFVGFVLDSVSNIPQSDRLLGHARFIGNTQLLVGDRTVVDASRVIIATGSSAVLPDMYASLGDRAIINDDVFAWDTLPGSVLVVGPGVIGLELGQALARLGVRVSVLGRSGGLAGISDPAVRDNAFQAFSAEFPLCLNAEVTSVERTDQGVHVQYRDRRGQHTELYDYVLLAVGRRPNVAGLGLENTLAKLDDRGMPAFNRQTLQLDGVPVFLAGDVNAQWPLLHEAADDGRIAGQNAAAYPAVSPGSRRAPLSVVFTDPQVMHVGLRFKQLPDSGVVIGEVDFADQGRSRVMLKNRGLLRVYAEQKTGKFLGAEMVGPAAEHLGHLLSWACQQGMTISQMLAMPFYHPVIEEGLRTALRDADRQIKA